MPYNNTSIV